VTIWDVFTWTGVGIGSLLGLLAVIALVGCFLRRYHVAARSLWSKQPPEAVWQAISDFAATPAWHPEVKTVEPVADDRGRTVWRETDRRGYALLLETVEAQPPYRLVRAIVDEDGPFSGQWEFDIVPTTLESGCWVTLTERGQVPNPFFRFMFRLFMSTTLYIDIYLRALAVKLGDEPVLHDPQITKGSP
jgi:hypothetical protein